MHLASPKPSLLSKPTNLNVVLSSIQFAPEPKPPSGPSGFGRVNWSFVLGMALMLILSAGVWVAIFAR
jgi:hypothetical protein